MLDLASLPKLPKLVLPNDPIPNTQGGWWIIGVAFALCGSLIGAFGDNIIRLAHRRATRDEKRKANTEGGEDVMDTSCNAICFCCGTGGGAKTLVIWLIGILMITIFNNGCTLASYSFADANLVLPFGALHIVWSVLFAHCINHERLTWAIGACAAAICVGVILVVVSGTKLLPNYTIVELKRFFLSWPCMVYMGVTACLFVTLAAGLCTRFCCKAWHRTGAGQRVYVACVILMCGVSGANTNLFAKIAVECIKTFARAESEDKVSLMKEPILYVGFIGILTCAPLQLCMLNYALKLARANLVTPVTNATLVCLGTLACIVFFEEYTNFSLVTWILLPIGLLLSAGGTLTLMLVTKPGAEHGVDGEADGLLGGEDEYAPVKQGEDSGAGRGAGLPILAAN